MKAVYPSRRRAMHTLADQCQGHHLPRRTLLRVTTETIRTTRAIMQHRPELTLHTRTVCRFRERQRRPSPLTCRLRASRKMIVPTRRLEMAPVCSDRGRAANEASMGARPACKARSNTIRTVRRIISSCEMARMMMKTRKRSRGRRRVPVPRRWASVQHERLVSVARRLYLLRR